MKDALLRETPQANILTGGTAGSFFDSLLCGFFAPVEGAVDTPSLLDWRGHASSPIPADEDWRVGNEIATSLTEQVIGTVAIVSSSAACRIGQRFSVDREQKVRELDSGLQFEREPP